MNTLIPISGGWKSAYLLIRWLKTNPGHVYALHIRTPEKFVNRRTVGYSALQQYVDMNYPDRVRWHDASINGIMPFDATSPREIINMVVGWFAKSKAVEITQVISATRLDLGKGINVKTPEVSIIDAMSEIPEATLQMLFTCEAGLLPCGKCPACIEIATARAQMGR
jgi:hypothetical protein